MSDAAQILSRTEVVVLVDWPSPEVPEALTRAGYKVFVKGGPGPKDYSMREMHGDEVISRPLGERPDHADLIYAYRPLVELAGIAAIGKQIGAQALWWATDPSGSCEDDSRRARAIAQEAGLEYVDGVDIVDTLRGLDRREV